MLIRVHPFDRYTQFTNVYALKEISALPLRKSFRVNTLKSSVEDFKLWAEKKGWKIEPVQWCSEGFFVCRGEPFDSSHHEQCHGERSRTMTLRAQDRHRRTMTQTMSPFDRAQGDTIALGKDLLHQLGHTYIQEAASMLPVELLDPQPGEAVLDMAAAPGSKTTQIAAKLQGKGVIVANDIQEKRLWTLKQALNRCGVTNTIVTKKKGEWFGKQMTERFDRVLCDSPCSAQGVLRKDPKALNYGSDKRIQKLAKNQINLLESAVHAAKVGGRIVYSTCTLTPEENEEVILKILEKFEGKVEIVDVRTKDKELGTKELHKAIEDSIRVQQSLSPLSLSPIPQPLLRLWPQTYDTEGFFCAVLEKTARTREPIELEMIPRQEKPLTPRRYRDITKILEEHFGTSFLQEGDTLLQKADQLLLTTKEAKQFPLPVQNYSLGLPFVKGIRDSAHIRLTHDLVTLRGHFAQKNVYDLSDEEAAEILAGKDIPCPEELRGDIILRSQGIYIGPAFAKERILKNRLSRQLISQI